MGQVLELFETDTAEDGIKKITIPAYQTSDGTIFHNQHEAEEYEAKERLVKSLVEDYQNWKNSYRVGGWTIRGMGDEFVEADSRTLEAYTRYVISQIKG